MEKTKTIALIDKDKIAAFVTELMFQKSNFKDTFLSFSNSESALNHFSEHGLPNILITDYSFSVNEDFKLLEQIRKIKKKQPCKLVLSYLFKPNNPNIISRFGISYSYQKPIQATDIDKILED